jgi:hypothetical protein
MDVDGGFETVRQAFAGTARTEGGRNAFERCKRAPEELLGQRGGTDFVGVGKVVTGRRRGGADGRERAGVQAQAVANIVEPHGVRELGEEQADDVTPGFERSGFFLRPRVAGQLGHQMRWNEIAELAEDGELGAGWRVVGLFFHPCRVAGKPTRANSTFHPIMGWLCHCITDSKRQMDFRVDRRQSPGSKLSQKREIPAKPFASSVSICVHPWF